MRRRADVSKPPAAATPDLFPKSEAPAAEPANDAVRRDAAPVPAGVEVNDGVTHLPCGKCGMKLSAGVVASSGWACPGCKTPTAPEARAFAEKDYAGKFAAAALDAKTASASPPEPAKKPAGDLVQEDLGDLAAQLAKLHHDVPLPALAAMAPDDRRLLRSYVLGHTINITRTAELLAPFKGAGSEAARAVARTPAKPEVVSVPNAYTGPVDRVPVRVDEAPQKPGFKPVETVTATWAEQKFSPVAYSSFGVGPFTITTAVRPGETHAQALERAHEELRAFADRKREAAFNDFMHSLEGFSKRSGGR